ncbi:predicted protein [Nematostella vectensis]|uniref:EGF-like repeat and discoidin I-like domain-containing protein 3 n=1 Tax=Nematostella vectensis TaxID=45351 RepID=A7RZQ5_NEMVE|nr:predicted protein [Nematostella vectensis]|eukprot:XP_001635095.1 predicted protein [Nematostella vectensis]
MTRIILYFAVLSVFTTISYCQKLRPLQRKPQNDFSFSNFVKQSFYYLNVKVLARSFENNPVLCWLKCLDVLSCFSVNVASSKDSESKFWCELLVTDKYNAPDKFLPNSSSHHYSISSFHVINIVFSVSQFQHYEPLQYQHRNIIVYHSQSQCEQIPCLHNGTCLPNYDDDTFTCICAVGYIGARCEKVRIITLIILLYKNRCLLACYSALGMEDGRIKNHQITASSDFGPMYKAYFGRVNQVDLEKAKYITMVATQGRPLEGGSWPGYYQWTKTYAVKFSDDGNNWADYSEGGVIKIFSGNTDSETVVKHDLVEPIKARYVRFLVKSWHNEPVMRVELYGCEP